MIGVICWKCNQLYAPVKEVRLTDKWVISNCVYCNAKNIVADINGEHYKEDNE